MYFLKKTYKPTNKQQSKQKKTHEAESSRKPCEASFITQKIYAHPVLQIFFP